MTVAQTLAGDHARTTLAGSVDSEPQDQLGREFPGVPTLGGFDRLREILVEYCIDELHVVDDVVGTDAEAGEQQIRECSGLARRVVLDHDGVRPKVDHRIRELQRAGLVDKDVFIVIRAGRYFAGSCDIEVATIAFLQAGAGAVRAGWDSLCMRDHGKYRQAQAAKKNRRDGYGERSPG